MRNTILSKKPITKWRPQVRSRHPSHYGLRPKGVLPLMPFPSVIRFGSSTELNDTIDKGGRRIEINTVEAIKISSNKLLMKQAFMEADINTADWCKYNEIQNVTEEGISLNPAEHRSAISFPIVAKHKFGSRGTGNTLIKSLEEYNVWRQTHSNDLNSFIFEKYYNYGLEFRLHITKDGCFYTCRKALKKDCPEDQKWRHHDDTCVWLMENNEEFKKPNSWEDIVDHCVRALEAIGADVLAFDVKVQSATNNKGKTRDYQEFIILESNSAPSFGEVTLEKYKEILPKLLMDKAKQYGSI